jgi:hypothetical protein
MSRAAIDLKIVPPDYDALLGYESGMKAYAEGMAVLVAPTLDEYNCYSRQGLPAVYPRDGKWTISLAEFVTGWQLCFAFTSLDYRIKTGRIVDGFAGETFKLKPLPQDTLLDWLTENDQDLDAFYSLTDTHVERFNWSNELDLKASRITATAYAWKDPKEIPEREWLYGNHLLRRYVSVTVAPGGVGKSRLITGEILAMVSGQRLFDQWVRHGLRVWSWNLEDDALELSRCIQAACKRHGLTESDIHGRLYIDSGRQQDLCTAITGKDGVQILQPVYDNIIEELLARKIDVLVIDPFVSSHRVNENDNGMIDAVVKAWAKVADAANCAIELVHHTRKEGGGEITADSARGGSAIMGAARDVRVLNRMTETEAENFGIDNPRSYFRAGSDKSNFAPVGKAQWYKIDSVSLLNDSNEAGGDSVGVCTRWTPPDPFDHITAEMTQQALSIIAQGEGRYSPQANDWAGYAIAEALQIDPAEKSGKSLLKRILWDWETNSLIKKVMKTSTEKAREIPYYGVTDND